MPKISIMQKNKKAVILVTGNFVLYDDLKEKNDIFAFLSQEKYDEIVICAQDVNQFDSSLVVVLYEILKFAKNHNIPVDLKKVPENLNALLSLSLSVDRKPTKKQSENLTFLERIGTKTVLICRAVKKGGNFIKTSLASLLSIKKIRKYDFLQALEACGPNAVLIVSLISFMVGLILAFVGAMQLKSFGAEIYVASLVTIGMIRIMGAVMVGIIMAGRTGASYAATIGTMQVNEELDALKTMGFSIANFLILPRLLAMMIAMPLLVIVADFVGMIGGAFVGIVLLNISPSEYYTYALDVFGLSNFLIGVFHGFVFAFVISICGCYYGIHCGRNADSVGIATTKAVVSSIVWMIVLTGVITLLCELVGV